MTDIFNFKQALMDEFYALAERAETLAACATDAQERFEYEGMAKAYTHAAARAVDVYIALKKEVSL